MAAYRAGVEGVGGEEGGEGRCGGEKAFEVVFGDQLGLMRCFGQESVFLLEQGKELVLNMA